MFKCSRCEKEKDSPCFECLKCKEDICWSCAAESVGRCLKCGGTLSPFRAPLLKDDYQFVP